MKVCWTPREVPLDPTGVAGAGAVAVELARALLRRPGDELARLAAFASRDGATLVITGETDLLPWRDGVVYLGRDIQAPRLLLPTLLAPSVPVGLLERALLAKVASSESPARVAVLPGAQTLVPLPPERRLARGPIEAWIEARRAS